MKNQSYCIGVDFGTDSVRSIIVNALDGEEVASAVFLYPRWRDQLYCDLGKNEFRQHPRDYLEGLETTIKKCLLIAGPTVKANIKAISVDTTGSTPVAVNELGIPLSLLPAFESNPNAMFVLWKDHSAFKEAAEINLHAKKFNINFLKYVGGIYSSEWFWAKLLHVFRTDEKVQTACYSWVEHCDWITFLLTGGRHVSEMKRSACTAGHKALWAEEFGGLPPDIFFSTLDPVLEGITHKMYRQVYTADEVAGNLCAEWASRLGLSTKVIIGIGAMDAHMGAVGGQIEPYYLCKVMGTSTCDMLVVPNTDLEGMQISGICGQVDGSIIPKMIGLEAGQSAFGDVYSWYKRLLLWPMQNMLAQSKLISHELATTLIKEVDESILYELGKQAAQINHDHTSELAIDWLNGRRTPDANPLLKGAISGLDLGSDATRIYKTLIEATCFGARKITDRFQQEGLQIKGLIGIGGIAKKSPYIMQMLSDVIKMPVRIHSSDQTCALGAAMFAATAANIYPNVCEAMENMGHGFEREYIPNIKNAARYDALYTRYETLGDFFENQTI